MKIQQYLATISYISCIVLLNALFVNLPGFQAFGDTLSAADIAVGMIYIVRDFAQREIQHYIIVAMIAGTAISYWLSDPTIAIASAGAFAVGECCDWAIFSFTNKPLSQRLLLSSIVSVPIDTVIFLALASRLSAASMTLMMLGKFAGIALLWAIWRRRHGASCYTGDFHMPLNKKTKMHFKKDLL
jgi:queuosine precursor transporter